MEDKDVLAEIGLTEREAKVYLALLELGSTTTGPIIKKSGVPNSKIYEILESLQNKGLVSWITRGKIKYFQAAEPKKILTLFEEKRKQIQQAIPLLEAKQLLVKEKQTVDLFEGINSIYAAFLDILEGANEGEEYCAFTSVEESENEDVANFYKKLGVKRHELGLNIQILANIRHKTVFEQIYKERIKFLKKIVRFSQFEFPGDIAIFKDKIILINWIDKPSAIMITSPKMAEQYKLFFNQLFQLASPF